MIRSVIAISAGASVGALMRYFLGRELNSLWPALPPGTLLANLIGAYLIGVAIMFFSRFPGMPPEWRLLIITGFLGGLTTFSTFSAEVTMLLQSGRIGLAMLSVSAHVVGSIGMTFLGIATVWMLRSIPLN